MAGFDLVQGAVQIVQARRARQYLYLYVDGRGVPMGPSVYWGDSFGGIVGALGNGAPAATHPYTTDTRKAARDFPGRSGNC